MNKNIIKCPICKSVRMTPLESYEGDWEDTHEWCQETDSAVMELTVSLICNNKHISIIRFTNDVDRVYHSVEYYSTDQLEGGLNSLFGGSEDDSEEAVST